MCFDAPKDKWAFEIKHCSVPKIKRDILCSKHIYIPKIIFYAALSFSTAAKTLGLLSIYRLLYIQRMNLYLTSQNFKTKCSVLLLPSGQSCMSNWYCQMFRSITACYRISPLT